MAAVLYQYIMCLVVGGVAWVSLSWWALLARWLLQGLVQARVFAVYVYGAHMSFVGLGDGCLCSFLCGVGT